MTTNYDDIPMPSDEEVQKLLNGVFDACDMTPNDVSLKKLSRSFFFKKRFGTLLAMFICLCGLVAIILIPALLFRSYNNGQTLELSNSGIAMTETDSAPPHITDDYEKDGYIYMVLQDYSSIDYSTLKIVTDSGAEVEAAFVNEESNTICINYPTETMTIYISDEHGNQMEVILSAK